MVTVTGYMIHVDVDIMFNVHIWKIQKQKNNDNAGTEHWTDNRIFLLFAIFNSFIKSVDN